MARTSDVVMVNGWVFAVVAFAFVFVFVASTGGGPWQVGIGLVALLGTGLFAVYSWHSLPDHPLTYRDGDMPDGTTQGTGLYDTWELESGARIRTVYDVDGGSGAESLAGELSFYGCDEARVRWRIDAGAAATASGTLGQRDERGLSDVALRAGPPDVVRLTAVRVDDADCTADLSWHNPGLEGPGNGEFRFVLPLPDP